MESLAVGRGGPMLGGPPPFIGRELELGWLEDCLREAQRGRARLALIAGEAGIGKSRLAREFGARARRAGARVAVGRGPSETSSSSSTGPTESHGRSAGGRSATARSTQVSVPSASE